MGGAPAGVQAARQRQRQGRDGEPGQGFEPEKTVVGGAQAGHRKADEAAHIVQPEPVLEQRRTAQVQGQRPAQQPRQGSQQGQAGRAAPARAAHGFVEGEQEQRPQQQHAGHEQALGQEADAGSGAQQGAGSGRTGARDGGPVQGQRHPGQGGQIGQQEVGVQEHAGACQQQQGRQPGLLAPPPDAGGARQQAASHSQQQGISQAGAVVQGQPGTRQPRAQGRHPVIQGRLFHEGLARGAWDQQVAAVQHVADDVGNIGLVLLPGLVANQAGQQIQGGQQQHQG